MSGNSFGKLFVVTSFGESHGPAIGCVVDGCPPGLNLSERDIQPDLDRRRPGTSRHDHLQNILAKFDLKMPQFVIPLRLILLGKSQTPSIIKVLGILPKKIVCQRIMKALET